MAKRKKLTLAKLKVKAQGIFNAWIRNRDILEDGTYICISCGKKTTKPNAGHYFPVKGYQHIRYDEHNVNVQCISCNGFLEGATIGYRRGLIRKIGLDAVIDLENRAFDSVHIFNKEEIEEIIRVYKW